MGRKQGLKVEERRIEDGQEEFDVEVEMRRVDNGSQIATGLWSFYFFSRLSFFFSRPCSILTLLCSFCSSIHYSPGQKEDNPPGEVRIAE